MLSEIVLVAIFMIVLMAPFEVELAGLLGIALAFSGLGSLCFWYFKFHRVWEKNHDFITSMDMLISQTSEMLPPDRFRHGARAGTAMGIGGRTIRYESDWTLFDFDSNNDRIPSRHFILLLVVVWHVAWSGALLAALTRLGEVLSPMAQLGIWVLAMAITAYVVTIINPRLGVSA